MILTDIGLLVVLVEILTLRKNPRDILSISKLSDRTFSKMWLTVGMEGYGAAAEFWSLDSNRIQPQAWRLLSSKLSFLD